MMKIISITIFGLLIFNGVGVITFQETVDSEHNHNEILTDKNRIGSNKFEMSYEISNVEQKNFFDSKVKFKEGIYDRNSLIGNRGHIFKKYPVMNTIIRKNYSDMSSELVTQTVIDLPDHFSWTEYEGEDWTTPARDQGDCGSCWLFAALGTFESIINIREGRANLDPDLSEQYVLSCLPEAGSCSGGTVEGALYYIADTSDAGNNCNGVITESCFPYQASDDVPCSAKSNDWMEYLVPIKNCRHVDLGYDTYRVREVLKSWIMENGPVATNMYVTELFGLWGVIFHNLKFYFPYIDITDNVYNHCVVIVGWKDDPSIRRGGYWICKNSWGTDWGDNGFFSIEYGSLNVADEIIWVDYDPESFDWPPGADYNNFNQESGNPSQMIRRYPINLGRCIPDVPTITGPISGIAGTEYEYNITTTAPCGDDVYYYVEWGDHQTEEWIGPYESGKEITVKHTWSKSGSYEIKVKARDTKFAVSEWSDPLPMSMPKTYVNPLWTLIEKIFDWLEEMFGRVILPF